MLPLPSSCSILIVEDNDLARTSLSFAMQSHPQFCVVAQARNGLEALELVEAHKPDIILMDIRMPEMDGITATQQIKQRSPQLKIIMLTSQDDPDTVFAALAAGANAYCMKDIVLEQLFQVIETVAQGAVWIDPAISKMVLSTFPTRSPLKQPAIALEKDIPLTAREKDVLSLIAEGKTNKEIADALVISANTVKTHVNNIMHKLSVSGRTQAAVKALQDGMTHASNPQA